VKPAGALARRYARALFELGKDSGQLAAMGKELADLAATWDASKDLRDAFNNPMVSAEMRRKILDAVGTRVGISATLKNTLQMLSDRRRLRHLPEIAEAFAGMAEAQSGRVRAEVITATQLPESYFAELQKALEQVTGRQVQLVRRHDPSLIAGVVTRVGDRVYDGSLKNQLAELEDELLDRNLYFNN
jgi:F-type H+-transporting ATPase subunit delta